MSRPVLVGSRALEYWDVGFKCRENADWDFLWCGVGDYNLPEVPSKCEVHYGTELNNKDLCSRYSSEGTEDYLVMSLEGLAVMKRSHLWRQRMFEKHITMYHRHLAEHLPTDAVGQQLLKDRIKLTKKAFPQRNPDLTQTNEDFFDDAVKKEFDHDWIHELVAYYDEPLYERLKTDDKRDKAWCEKDLWAALPYEDKCRCVAEECHVIACERFMIPNDWDFIPKKAYYMALNKACTTLTSGWFRDFAIDNFPEILKLFNQHKFDKVKKETTK